MIEFIVWGESVAKGRPKFATRGKYAFAYTPKKTRDAENDFRLQVIKYKPEKPLEGEIYLEIKSYRSIPKSFSKKKIFLAGSGKMQPITRPDWDNLGKLITDAGNGILWKDDSQIVKCIVSKYYSTNPRTEIRIETESN